MGKQGIVRRLAARTTVVRRVATAMAVAVAVAVATLAGAQPALATAPDVVVTLKPVHSLVAAVMEGVGTPHLLIDGAASPHTYAMKPSEVRRLNAAAVVVRVSARLEVFLGKALSLVGKQTRVVTLDELPGMVLYTVRAGGDFEAHRHDHEPASSGRKHGHGHGHKSEPKATDGHLWLDPRNARVVVLHMGEVLAAAMPSEASRLRDNAKAVAGRLEALDRTVAAELAPVGDKPFLVFHDAYQYLERRYGLAGAGSVTVNPEVPASARRLSQIRERLAQARIVCVFAEPQFSPRAIDTIIEGTNVRRASLDPLGANLAAGSNHYFVMMETLARDLKACVAGSA